MALAFLPKHEGKDELAETMIQNLIHNYQPTITREELKKIFAKITYRNQLTFDAFVAQTQAYRPEWVREKTIR